MTNPKSHHRDFDIDLLVNPLDKNPKTPSAEEQKAIKDGIRSLVSQLSDDPKCSFDHTDKLSTRLQSSDIGLTIEITQNGKTSTAEYMPHKAAGMLTFVPEKGKDKSELLTVQKGKSKDAIEKLEAILKEYPDLKINAKFEKPTVAKINAEIGKVYKLEDGKVTEVPAKDLPKPQEQPDQGKAPKK